MAALPFASTIGRSIRIGVFIMAAISSSLLSCSLSRPSSLYSDWRQLFHIGRCVLVEDDFGFNTVFLKYLERGAGF